MQREKVNISSLQETAAIDFGGRKNWQTVWINFRRTIFKAAMLIYIIWIHVYIDILRILVLDDNIWSIHVALTFLPSWGYLARIVEQYLKIIWSIRVARITFLPSWGYLARCTIFTQYLNNIWTIFELYLNNSWTIFEQYCKQLFCTSYISSFYLAQCNLSHSSSNIFSSFSSIYKSHLN